MTGKRGPIIGLMKATTCYGFRHYPGGHSMNNKFIFGKECDMVTVGDKKFKATMQTEGGRAVVDVPNTHQTCEIVDGKLESSISGETYDRVSKRLA